MTVPQYVPRISLRSFLLVTLALGCCFIFLAQTSPTAKAYTTCQTVTVSNLALSSGGPAQYTISGVLCTNPCYSTYTQTVTILVSGATYSHIYWDWPNTANETNWAAEYSAAQYLAHDGFSTFNIDRIGVGASSHPASSLIDIASDAYVLHELVGLLKAGAIGGITFGHVLLAGHALGSAMVLAEANTYHDVDAVIVTSFLHIVNPNAFPPSTNPTVQLDTASTDSSGDFSSLNLDSGYLTTVPNTRDNFYYSPSSDPAVIAYDEQMKQTTTQDEVNGLSNALSSTTTSSINVPILSLVGQQDAIFCVNAVNCSSNTSVYNEEASYYPQAQLQVAVIANTGHTPNLEETASTSYGTIEGWLAAMYPPVM